MSALADRLKTLASRLAATPSDERPALLAKLTQAGVRFADLPIPRADRSRALPASDTQRRLWFLARLDPDSAAYVVGGGLRLKGRLDVDALSNAFAAVIARHEALRTTFQEDASGVILQTISPSLALDIARHDVPEHSMPDVEEALAGLARDIINRPFDLEHGPLLRAELVRRGDEDHTLLIALHHMICDAWSLDILTREMSDAYALAISGHQDDRPMPPLQFADWSNWQDVRQDAKVGDEALQRCRQALVDLPSRIELSVRRRENAASEPALCLPLTFDATTCAAIRELTTQRGVTPFAVFLAALAVFLGRSAGRRELCIGVPVANRGGAATHGIVGPLVNTIALRLEVDSSKPFVDLVDAVAAASRDALSDQDLPFERVVEGLGESGAAPFDVMYGYQRAPLLLHFPGLSVHRLDAVPETPKVDLVLGIEEADDGRFSAAFILDAGRFSRDDGLRLAARFTTLCASLLAKQDVPCGEASMLPADERIVLESQQSHEPTGAFVSIVSQLSARSSRFGSSAALVWADGVLSYADLAARSEALARRLRRRGAGREARVAVCRGRGAEAFVALLAVLKAGAAYVPLDPETPPERLALMLAEAGVGLAVTDHASRERLPADLPTVLVEDPEAGDVTSDVGDDDDPAPDIHPDQLAYVIFTSGSTGTPKGVAVSHGALAMHVAAIGNLYGITSDDRLLHLISLAFDGATECWLAALCHGASLVVGDPRGWTAADTLAAIRREGVTITGMSPALLASLAAAHEATGGGPLPVRSWTAGGEAFAVTAFDQVRRAFWPARLVNGYGPTETVVTPLLFMATAQTPETAWADTAWLPIGRPVGARTAYVLDDALQEVGIGAGGELFIGGTGLARGYLGAPGLTAARFVPDPFGAPGGRLYRTGDKVRRRADGSLDYLGRLDAQVKIRGFRIEPGEVEAHLLAHPGCREAAVVATTRAGEAHLVAYVAGEATPETLAGHLAGRLPEHLRPALIVALPALPRLVSGKIDRAGLPAPNWRSVPYAAPCTETERALADIWQSLLGHERIGRDDNFFTLGGHSLIAAKLVTTIKNKMGRDVPLRAVFDAPGLVAMAARVDAAPRVEPERRAIRRAPRDVFVPATDMQTAIWDWQRLHPHSGAYNIFGAIRLRGSVDFAALERSLAHVVTRHEALRTTFRLESSCVFLVTEDAGAFRLDLTDLTREPIAIREEAARAFTTRQASEPFDLERDLPIRAKILRLAETDHVLSLTVHHAVADGWSMALLMQEIATCYRSFSAARGHVDLDIPAYQLRDYAVWRGDQDRRSDRGSAALSHGVNSFRSHPIAANRTRVGSTTAGTRLRRSIKSDIVVTLRERALSLGVTMPMVALAALGATLRARGDMAEVSIGLLVADRPTDFDETIGCLLVHDMTIIRADLEAPFADLVAAVSEERVTAQANGPFHLERFRSATDARLGQGDMPFQTLFNYRRSGPDVFDLGPDVAVHAFPVESHDECFEIEFDLDERVDGGLAISVGYLTDLFDPATITAVVDDFLALMIGASRDFSSPIASLLAASPPRAKSVAVA